MSDFTPKVHRNISLPAGTHPPEIIRRTYSESDAEATGNAGAPSGGSSSSSLSSRSNESAAGQPENQDSHSEWSEEEDNAEPWSTRASAEVLATLSMKARKRQDLIHELITTEISHVRWLRILRRVFLSPLQRSNLLPASELKALFPNLPDVLQRHRKLSADLKTLAATASVVKTKPLAEALINTLGEPKYPVALAKFCGGQRLALDVLKDRQKRNKELYNFISRREQEPLCARKRLQDFLACVWQRLTKYQLLLEGISKTITDDDEESDPDNKEAVVKLAHALDLAKDILHTVDTAIKTTENEHRLRTIQSKLEVRGVGTESEPGELRRLDLVRHSLVIEGSLLIRQDSTKRLTVHALMLSECLVLLQKESDRYILRPIPQAAHQPLSPVVHWNTVFFRTNAAVKNGFFLVNINGVQMYDMSVNSSTEYNTWIRHISEAAKALGPRSNPLEEGPPPPLPSNPPPVTATNTEEPPESSEPNTSVDEKDEPPTVNEDDGTIVSGATRLIEGEIDDGRRPNKFVNDELTNLSSVDIIVPPPTLTAYRQLTAEERLRQAEEKVKLALQEAAEAAKEVAESSPSFYSSAMESLFGKMPTDKQWRTSIGNGLNVTTDNDRKSSKDLLLMAQSHVNTLTEVLFKALRVSPVGSDCAMTKCSVSSNHGFCDSCFNKHAKFIRTAKHDSFGKGDEVEQRPENEVNDKTNNADLKSDEQNNGKFDSFVMLEEPGESSTDPGEETDLNLVTTSSLGLREVLSMLLQRLPNEERERELLRSRLQQADSRLHYLHHIHRDCVHTDGEMEKDSLQEVPDFISNDKNSEG